MYNGYKIKLNKGIKKEFTKSNSCALLLVVSQCFDFLIFTS
ncbi:hypothetical protein T190607A02C_30067 [Tenacibaculum sp. 190524A02b]